MPQPLHNLNPTARFSDRADDYARFRPTYPAAAIDAMINLLGTSRIPPEQVIIADIGAGTGISSRLIADRGCTVIAIEPNAAMRDAAEPHPRVTWQPGTGESTGLADHSVALVLCAQAFHWFDAPRALAEFHRVLCPAAPLCLLWNDRANADPLTAEYGRIILEASENHPAARDRSDCAMVLFATPLFRDAQVQAFPSAQQMTREDLIGRALSASYAPKHGPRHDAMVAALTAVHARFADAHVRVVMRYTTRLFSANAAP